MPHGPAQGVDFLHQVPLGQAPHRRVAGHGRHRVQVEAEQQDLESHAGGRQGPFAAGVPGPYHNQVKFCGINSHGGHFTVELPMIFV